MLQFRNVSYIITFCLLLFPVLTFVNIVPVYHTFCLYNYMRTISTQETAGRCSCRVWKRESWSGIPAPFSREIQHPELLLSFSRISFSFLNRFRFQILANPARLPDGSQIPYPVNVFSNLALYFNQITDAGNLSFSDRP